MTLDTHRHFVLEDRFNRGATGAAKGRAARGRVMRIAVFTDNDFDKTNGVTTTLRAVLSHRPDDLDVRIYTASALASNGPDYLALAAFGMPIPWYGEMRMYAPPLRGFRQHLAADGIT